MINHFANEMVTEPLSNIKLHLKLESLLKSEPIETWRKVIARPILWQRFAVTALFSPIFLEAKKRLKTLLHSKIVYADGLQPD